MFPEQRPTVFECLEAGFVFRRIHCGAELPGIPGQLLDLLLAFLLGPLRSMVLVEQFLAMAVNGLVFVF